MILYDGVYNSCNPEMSEQLYSKNFCYDEEKYFQNYCDLDKMSKPINATFDVSQPSNGWIKGYLRGYQWI
ncbi:unnamed protein product [Meloidogyne enterolobii]